MLTIQERVRVPARALNAFNRTAGRRLLCAAVVTALAFVLQPGSWTGQTRFLVAWVLGASTLLLLAYLLVINATEEMTEHTASAQDQSSSLLLSTALIATAASLIAILLLQDSAGLTMIERLGKVVLSALAVFCAWLILHVSFAFHYAHRYYGDVVAPFGSIDRGLDFPGRSQPDYLDFAYLSFVIGMTSQVSDVVVTSHRMRRLVLLHGISSFAYYTVILALVINIIASTNLRPA
ncbi:MAG TPA: DUF1345 domain-containing protein [Burkholderiaceae bacterium]|jgi:uncharacterized membrane protein|nr:DUF1345 domain-containing protein [Burkholderiaceae bacterium]